MEYPPTSEILKDVVSLEKEVQQGMKLLWADLEGKTWAEIEGKTWEEFERMV